MPTFSSVRPIVACVVGLATLALAGACSSAAPDSDAPAASTAITTAWPADITSLDPANLSTGQDRTIARNVYQPLLSPKFAEQSDGSMKFQGAQVVPLLAESWTTKNSSITFKLRPGVKFHGTDHEVTADDVKFSLARIWKTPGVGDFKANGLQSPEQITVVDSSTVTIDFVTPDGKPTPVTPTLMAIFGQAYTSIVDEQAVKPHMTSADPTGSKWLRENAVGTGPYAIADRKAGTSITLQASEDSWMPKPSYPTVNIQITSSGVSSLLRNQTINYADSGYTNAQVNALSQAGLKAVWQDTGFFDMFAITSGPADQVGALADKRVRQAIAYALPYQEVLDNVAFGRGTRAKSIVMPSAPEYQPAWEQYSTDLDKATALMAQAGNPSIDVPLYYLQGDDDQTNTALLIQANLTKIGITSNLTPQTQAGLFDIVNARSQPATGAKIGPPGLELFNWTAWTDDPKIVIGYWATKGGINNYPLWNSDSVDAANSTYALEPTSTARTAAYQKAQDEIAEAAPLIPIITTGAVIVTSPEIAGVSFAPTGSGRFWTLHPTGTTSATAAVVS